MKYILKSDNDPNGAELEIAPSNDDGPDHVLWVYPSLEDPEQVPPVVYLKVSDIYAFIDWLKGWAPDPRQPELEESRYSKLNHANGYLRLIERIIANTYLPADLRLKQIELDVKSYFEHYGDKFLE